MMAVLYVGIYGAEGPSIHPSWEFISTRWVGKRRIDVEAFLHLRLPARYSRDFLERMTEWVLFCLDPVRMIPVSK